jgi:hypothetical protein
MIALFRGGPIDGLQFDLEDSRPPDILRGFLVSDPDNLEVPPVGTLEYHRQDIFVLDLALKMKAVLYVWNKQ